MSTTNAYIALSQTPTEDEAHWDDIDITSSAPTRRRNFGLQSKWFESLQVQWRETSSRVTTFVGTNLGMLLIIFAQFFFVCMNLGVKQLDSLDVPMHTLELIAVRMAITLACCILYMVIMKIPDPFLGPKGVRLLLVNRGLCGFFGLFGMYYSLQYLSLADATVLSFLMPLSAALGGYLILKEPYSKREAFAAIVSLLGVILIARPPFLFGNTSSVNSDSSDVASRATAADRIRAVCVAVFGIILGTGALLSMRAIGRRAHPMHLMMFFSAWCTFVASAAMYFMKIPIVYPHNWQWAAMLIFIGLSGFFAQTLTTIGFQRETAARGSMCQYIQLLFAGVLEYVFFGTVPSTLSLIGAAIIMTTAIYVIVSKKGSPKGPEAISLREPESALEEGLLSAESLNMTIKLADTSSSERIEHDEDLNEKPPSS
ncbi:EamA-like transporter family-domain-containing protein [Suillus clintonianus]|uniref:EamA-like transporter family-domain-containing protein n=1 Tax=Suillus clintonianus TaxID=1904413 RepID=UPI001B8642F3|nr:EamA-like transporter family-domain-containing protein [Suillus clintonianus]KAG2148837.1 EamA-like transporter family-domain-containing protein [Suillus clintonianus]